jgi:phototropin
VQYFIGVQLDGTEHVEPLHNCIPEDTTNEGFKLVQYVSLLLTDPLFISS